MITGYYNLEEFLGGYFHQDWREDALTAVAILDRYLNEWPIEHISKALSELNTLLAQTDDKVAETIVSMGCYYNPAADSLSYRQWLNQMASRLNYFLKNNSK